MESTNIIVSSGGRRVGLLGCLREALMETGHAGFVSVIDCGLSAPARFLADHAWLVPRCDDPRFSSAVQALCRNEKISLLVPTIDPELPVYADERNKFLAAGTRLCVSGPDTVRICGDKCLTHGWLASHGFPTVRQASPVEVLDQAEKWTLPLIVKPRNGSASIGVRRIECFWELEALELTDNKCIVQEFARGREFTINIYVNRNGECVTAVPHWRMEVRAGEVSKGVTVKHRLLISLARAIGEALPDAYGPLNVQCFLDDDDFIKVIEINARFGGGYPLAHRAGARFTHWLVNELEDKVPGYFDDWTDGLTMLRYDEAVYTSATTIRKSCHA